MNAYIVYVKSDAMDRVIAINSSAFLDELTDWIEIDSGSSDKYHHAQSNYLDKSLCTDDGIFQYKLVNGVVVERTSNEIEEDLAAQPAPSLTPEERIAQLEEDLIAAKILLGVE